MTRALQDENLGSNPQNLHKKLGVAVCANLSFGGQRQEDPQSSLGNQPSQTRNLLVQSESLDGAWRVGACL